LRSSNPFAPSGLREDQAPLDPLAVRRPTGQLSEFETAEPTPPRPMSGRVGTPIAAPAPAPAATRRKLGLLVGLVLASAVAVGLLLTRVHF
jgi:hypothetical protein